MAITKGTLTIPVTTAYAGQAFPINARIGASQFMTLEYFYESTWASQAACKGRIINFTGGSGRGYSDTVTTQRVVRAVSQGYMFFNTIAPPLQVTNLNRLNQSPVHNYYNYACECEMYLNALATDIAALPAVAPFYNANGPIVLCGTSRGAGVVAEWSELSRGTYATHKSLVKGLLLNAPAGSENPEGFPLAYAQNRSIYGFYEKTNHPTLGTFGAGDSTNAPRQMVERAYRGWKNPLLNVQIIGDSTYSHTWTYTHQTEWIDLAITLFP